MITMDDVRHRVDSEDGLDVEVAIVGAGISGLYSGYRLLLGDVAANSRRLGPVHVFDLGDRIGGRLLSTKLPDMDVTGELGGMRYMTSQMMVTALIEQVFRLDFVDFPMGDPDHHLMYMRRQRFAANAWTAAQAKGEKFHTHYHLNEADVGFSPDQLFNKLIYDVLVADPWFVENYGEKVSKKGDYDFEFLLTRSDWDEVKPQLVYNFPGSPYAGMKVNDLGFWNLIKDQIGQEGYDYLDVAGGYYSNTINWNAAEAFPYMVGDFSNLGTQYHTIKDGYDQIAYALAKAYAGAEGSGLWLKNRLETFRKSESGPRRYTLEFHNIDTGAHWHVHADRIILAMPRRSLELLDQQNFFFSADANDRLGRGINSVILEPAFKLLLGFESPWWIDDLKTEAGESITDLPMRQCYYFGVDPTNNHALLLAGYNDMRTVEYWKVLLRHRFEFPEYKPRPSRNAAIAPLTAWHESASTPGDPAPEAMVKEAMAQLRELHGSHRVIPDPYIARLMDWGEDPYGAGYHAWRAVTDVKTTMPFMRRPDMNEAIHIIGEAYSDQQGWVEGALCVAENMLQDWFEMPWPSWLDKTYYLGW